MSTKYETRFMDNPALDKTLRIVTALAREVYVLQDRLAIMETKLEQKGCLTRKDLDEYRPSSEEEELIKKRRDLFIERVLGPIVQEDR